MATETRYQTHPGINYKDGSVNNGSQMIGWDSRQVRAEVYKFDTGHYPITHIRWWGPQTSLYQGSDIPIRFVISTSPQPTLYGAVAGSYELKKNATNELDVYLAAETEYYFTFFPGISRDSGWGLHQIDYVGPDNWFTVWSVEQTYTACGAPTTLSLSRSIQIPGQNVTLSWSGATAGTNTTISGYNIYRSTSAGGSYSYLGTSTSTSYTVAAPSAGTYYYYKIVTQCAQSTDYNSGFSVASSGLKGNTVPSAPSVSTNRTVIPSTGGSVTFTVTAGSDPDGQTRTLYYATSSNGTKINFTSPLTVTFNAAATYYFYTYDGLQYSSATSKSITKNTKPVISSATYNARTMYDALGGNGTTGSQLGYASAITPKISTNKTGTILVELEYYSSDNTTAWSSSSVTRKTLQQSSISATSNVVLNNYNIHQYISLGSNNIHWRLRFRLSDSVESSDYVYYPASNQYYSIARASSVISKFNQFSTTNVSGTIDGEIWRNVRLKIYNDTSVPLATVAAKVNGTSVSASATTSVDGVYRYVDITVADGIAGGATINLTAQMKDSATSITKTISTTVTETKIPSVTTVSHGASTIKPFTGTGSFSVSTGWPFGSYEAINATTLAAYNCNTTPSNVIKFIHSSSNSGSGANRVVKTPTWSKSGDNITASLDRATIYDWNHSLGIANYSGTVTYYCRIEITNLFGKVITTPWLSRAFDFREVVVSPTISSIDWSTDATNWTALGANDKLQQGIYIRFNCSFGLYTTDEVVVSMLLTNSSGEKSLGCYESGSPNKITPITYANTELTRATNRTAVTNTKAYIYHITSEIADATNRKWRLKIDTTGGTSYSSYTTTGVTRQCAPDLELTECTIDQNYYFSYAYTMSDNGGADTLTNYLSDGTNELTNALSGTSGNIQAKEGFRDWEVKTVSVKSVSVVTGLITNTKTYYSNAIIVYQISPTVAYRKNQLGINTNNPNSEAIVDIHPATGKNTILIQGLDNNLTPTKYEINTATGQIKFYFNNTLQSTIDLKNGILT